MIRNNLSGAVIITDSAALERRMIQKKSAQKLNETETRLAKLERDVLMIGKVLESIKAECYG